jgi:ketopantoate reductase
VDVLLRIYARFVVCQDGRRMELEALHGFVVRRGAQHGLAVPTSEAVYAILQPWAIRNQKSGDGPLAGH